MCYISASGFTREVELCIYLSISSAVSVWPSAALTIHWIRASVFLGGFELRRNVVLGIAKFIDNIQWINDLLFQKLINIGFRDRKRAKEQSYKLAGGETHALPPLTPHQS